MARITENHYQISQESQIVRELEMWSREYISLEKVFKNFSTKDLDTINQVIVKIVVDRENTDGV